MVCIFVYANKGSKVNKVIFEQCKIELNNNFASSNATASNPSVIHDFQFLKNKVKFLGALSSGDIPACNFFYSTGGQTVGNANISNNIFYSQSEDTRVRGQFFVVIGTAETTIKLENNTFCNYIQNSQGIKAKLTGDWSVRYNIFYSNISATTYNTSYLICALEGSTFPASNDAFESNVAYNAVEENATAWNVFHGDSMKPSGDYNAKIPQEEESPLQIVDWEKGEFVSLKAGYGATIE